LEELKQAVKAEAERRPEAGELTKQKGIGAVIALAYILTIGPVERMLAKLKQVKTALRVRMHQPLAVVGRWLRSVIHGYFNYHAVPGNLASLGAFGAR
jgi:hypothetical protein